MQTAWQPLMMREAARGGNSRGLWGQGSWRIDSGEGKAQLVTQLLPHRKQSFPPRA